MQLHDFVPVRALFKAQTSASMLLIGLLLGMMASPSTALAQAARKPELPTIRKTDLTGIDRNSVNTWINQQVQQLLAATNDRAIQAQGQEFYQAIATNVKAADATAKFREGIAAMLADAVTKQYKPESNQRPLAKAYVLMALGDAAQPAPAVVNALKLGLTDTTAGGRVAAAAGLLGIRDKLTDEQWRSLLPIVQKAASTEANVVALDRFYRLLMVGPGPRVAPALPIVLNILDARLTRLDQKQGWPVLADAEAVKWMGDKLTGQNAQVQNRATLAIARVLTNATYAYQLNPVENQLEGLEKTIIAAEAQLKKIVPARATGAKLPSPDVTSVMLENSDDQKKAMLAALNKWIGTSKDAGVLNGAPFNFDRGLKIDPPTPAANPAAAG